MNMKNLSLTLALAASLSAQAQHVLDVQTQKLGAPVQSTMYGIFFEDINYAADGGLYAELVMNRSFEFPNHFAGWDISGRVELKDDGPFDRNPHYVRLAPPGHRDKYTMIENHGFFGSGQRQRLAGVIRGIDPERYNGNTPLVHGLNAMAAMVDGVNADAVGVLISDGEDTCDFTQNVDICQLARRIHARKPRLKIHTILLGSEAGKAACVARATGGRVFSPKDAAQINDQIQQAGNEFKQVCK